jgi:hypothetical protein
VIPGPIGPSLDGLFQCPCGARVGSMQVHTCPYTGVWCGQTARTMTQAELEGVLPSGVTLTVTNSAFALC